MVMVKRVSQASCWGWQVNDVRGLQKLELLLTMGIKFLAME